MAIDNRDKRASALGVPGVVYSNPDGSLDLGDRQQATGLYRGIEAGAVVIVTTGRAKAVAGHRMKVDAGHRLRGLAGYRMKVVGE